MQLTKKLLGYLNRVFNKDPLAYLAIQLTYNGGMTWTVADGVLSTQVVGGPGQNLTLNLANYTIGSLVTYLAAQPGYTTLYSDTSVASGLSALVLIDGSGDISQTNGDHLNGYANVLWSYMEACAAELQLLAAQIQNLPNEMATTTADSIWLDMLGSFYNVPRNPNEVDSVYGPRIIAQVLRPANNNVAIAEAITAFTGQQATVVDVSSAGISGLTYNAADKYDGSFDHNSGATLVYGLFDVQYAFDLINGQDLSNFQTSVVALVDSVRAAGTHLRALTLGASALYDTLTAPTDGAQTQAFNLNSSLADTLTTPTDSTSIFRSVLAFVDALTAPTDSIVLYISQDQTYNGARLYDGNSVYSGGTAGEVF